MMAKKKTFREIQEKMKEITKRPPSREQLEDLKNTFVEIERIEREPVKKPRPAVGPAKKIARDSETGL
jgi:hypothetical protein